MKQACSPSTNYVKLSPQNVHYFMEQMASKWCKATTVQITPLKKSNIYQLSTYI